MKAQRKITRDEVMKVAVLARLEAGEEEVERLARSLGAILGYMEKLEELDTTGVEPLAHILDLSDVMRPDEAVPPAPRQEYLSGAPRSRDGFFLVPAVIE